LIVDTNPGAVDDATDVVSLRLLPGSDLAIR
jgi:hypothetical protein